MDVEVSWLSYEEVKIKANQFLDKYHPTGSVPVPIEEIVEFELEMDIFPLPNFRQINDADGGTAIQISTIFIDEDIADNWPNRYRFTLAHEAGHLILHNLFLDQYQVTSSKDVINLTRSIPEGVHSRMEFQAHDFAGLILVSTPQLELAIFEMLKQLPDTLKISKHGSEIIEYGSKFIGNKFEVSSQVIQKRIQKEPHLAKLFE